MGLFDVAANCFMKKYATFSGRATRKEFISWEVFKIISYIFVFCLVSGMFMLKGEINIWAASFGVVLLSVIYIVPSISLIVRRLHDSGSPMSNLILLVFGFIPYIGFVFTIWLLVVLLKPSAEDNKWGPKSVKTKDESKLTVGDSVIYLLIISIIVIVSVYLSRIDIKGHGKITNDVDDVCAVKTSFAEEIQKANQLCPIPVALGLGEVTSITLEEGFVTYTISCNDNMGTVMFTYNDDHIKEMMMMSFFMTNAQGNNNGNQFLEILKKEKVGVKYVFKGSLSGEKVCSLTLDEIIALQNKLSANPNEALYKFISMSLAIGKAELPMLIDEGMELIDYLLEKDNIVLVVSLDESMYSLNALDMYKHELKMSLNETLQTDPQSKAFLDLCKLSHSGLIYRYQGNISQRNVDIQFSSQEIRMFTNTPASLNIQ